VLRVRRVYAGRLDQRDGDGRAFGFEFHPERVRKTFDGVLRRAVHALHGDGAIRERRADVDDRAAAPAQVARGDLRAVNDAPEVGLEQAAVILVRHVEEVAVDGDARVVDPGVEAAEALLGRDADAVHVAHAAHVGDDVDGLAALAPDLLGQALQRLLGARGQHETRAAPSGHPRRHQTDARRRARDHDCLLAQLLQSQFHRSPLA
jgi:hypothetical protein